MKRSLSHFLFHNFRCGHPKKKKKCSRRLATPHRLQLPTVNRRCTRKEICLPGKYRADLTGECVPSFLSVENYFPICLKGPTWPCPPGPLSSSIAHRVQWLKSAVLVCTSTSDGPWWCRQSAGFFFPLNRSYLRWFCVDRRTLYSCPLELDLDFPSILFSFKLSWIQIVNIWIKFVEYAVSEYF